MIKSQFIIKKMRPSDISLVSCLEKIVFGNPWNEEAIISTLSRKDTIACIAMNEDQLIGYGIAIASPYEAEILRIAVDPAMRRKGAASIILKYLIDSSCYAGAENIFLEVRKSNNAAYQLYLSAGFKQYSSRRDYYRNPTEDANLMVLSAKAAFD